MAADIARLGLGLLIVAFLVWLLPKWVLYILILMIIFDKR